MDVSEKRRGMTSWRWGTAALVTVLLMVLLLLLRDERYFFYGDTQVAYYGWWYHLGDLVRDGRWPILEPHEWRAGNLLTEGQRALFNPLAIGIGLLATASSSVLVLATVVKVALVCMGSLGVFVLVRSYDVAAPLAYVAAVTAPMGGMTQYLDLPSWAAGLTIWAIFPWVWWALRGSLRSPVMVAPALAFGYLMVTVGYVYGTIMLILLLVACLVDGWLARDSRAMARVIGIGAVCGLVAVAVYLPAVLTAPVTVRGAEFGGLGGKFTTDPLAMFTSLLPTASVHGTSAHLLPYAYLTWFLPVLLWLDGARLRRGWRPLAGLLVVTVVTLLIVDGPARFGPLRWPLRLQPFLVQAVVVLAVVVVTRFAVRRPSAVRLGVSLLWVVVAGAVAFLRAPSLWTGHLVSVGLVCAGVAALWWALRTERGGTWVALVVGVVTLAAAAWQHTVFPEPPSPERNMPASLADYRRPLSHARGDVMVVGDPEPVVKAHPEATADFLVGSAWYLNGHHVQNGYTTVSHGAYFERYCMTYQGSTCPEALTTLLDAEPESGMRRIDLLGVSTLLLVRADFSTQQLHSPPDGWRVADSTRWSVTWVRRDPMPGAGQPAWSSAGTVVTPVSVDDRTTRFRVQSVPSGGGRVVLSLLAWPGYSSDVGQVTDPVEGYLLTVDLPEDSAGQLVTVQYSSPAWPVVFGSWWLGVAVAVGWSGLVVLRRRRPSATTNPVVA